MNVPICRLMVGDTIIDYDGVARMIRTIGPGVETLTRISFEDGQIMLCPSNASFMVVEFYGSNQ